MSMKIVVSGAEAAKLNISHDTSMNKDQRQSAEKAIDILAKRNDSGIVQFPESKAEKRAVSEGVDAYNKTHHTNLTADGFASAVGLSGPKTGPQQASHAQASPGGHDLAAVMNL